MDLAGQDGARALVLGAALLTALALEQRAPTAPLVRPWRTNLGLWLVDTLLMRVVCGACGVAVAAWAGANDVGLLRLLDVPAALGVAVAIVALDGVSYLWHRANHRFSWLWRWHRIHHADRAFQVTTALRFHPGELLLALPVRLLAIVVLGVSPTGVVAFELVFGVMNLLVHGNFDLPRRWDARAARVFVTPALHRLHHARNVEHLNRNFATVFALFDRMGGTWAEGRAGTGVETGLPEAIGACQMSLGDALAAPFSSAGHGRDAR